MLGIDDSVGMIPVGLALGFEDGKEENVGADEGPALGTLLGKSVGPVLGC